MVDYRATGWLIGVLALASFVAGCSSDYDHLTFSEPRNAEHATLSEQAISITVGDAVSTRAIAYDECDDPMDDLRLQTDDAGPIGVAPGPEDGIFIFYGRMAGNGTVRVRVEGDLVAEIPVTVTDQ